jgi:hypothetical protein
MIPTTLENPFGFPEDDLGTAPAKVARGADAKTVKFSCTNCGGSGSWRGQGKCYACDGKGYFLTSERDRQNAKVQRRARKVRRLQAARAAFDEENPGVAAMLAKQAEWSMFARDLIEKLHQYGSLSERQVATIRSTEEKTAQRRQERATERAAGNATVDLSPIRAMFEKAVESGHKHPTYRAAGLKITRAPEHGRNPGALYVNAEDGEYLGKIIGTEYSGKPAPGLAAIAADPRGEAVKYGQRTGSCSVCGRELTVEASIEAGLGPVCASKWGL